VNTSPEPASNVIVSAGEDVTVASVVSLSLLWPWVAASIAGFLLLLGGTVVWLLASRIQRYRRRRQAQRLSTG
jgi:membrane protein YqaA with SNARE-associated domain